MQSVMESLCRCFGTTPLTTSAAEGGGLVELDSIQEPSATHCGSGAVLSASDIRRRTRSLALKDKQWDALFHDRAKKRATNLEVASHRGPAAATRPKRKRSTSRDAIFRSKKPDLRGGAAPPPNPFSRFLSNHPALANSLCFATPIHDPEDVAVGSVVDDTNSVVSDTNTLNTAEDTITSTLYYETTKLAGLQQTTPPMPLFNTFAVDERDDIHQIVTTRSHSSQKWMDWYHPQPSLNRESGERTTTGVSRPEVTPVSRPWPRPSATPPSRTSTPSTPVSQDTRAMAEFDEEAMPPPMTHSSSGSSGQRSEGSRR